MTDNPIQIVREAKEAICRLGDSSSLPDQDRNHLETIIRSALDSLQPATGDFAVPKGFQLVPEELSRKFKLNDRVQKTKGSSWHGRVVGFYSTKLTPTGYCIESEREPGSVQIYPEAALEAVLAPG